MSYFWFILSFIIGDGCLFNKSEFMIQVRNSRTVNRTGQPTGYKLVPGSSCLPLAGADAKFLRKASFFETLPMGHALCTWWNVSCWWISKSKFTCWGGFGYLCKTKSILGRSWSSSLVSKFLFLYWSLFSRAEILHVHNLLSGTSSVIFINPALSGSYFHNCVCGSLEYSFRVL